MTLNFSNLPHDILGDSKGWKMLRILIQCLQNPKNLSFQIYLLDFFDFMFK